MPPKLDTPIKTSQKAASSKTLVSNEDIMSALKSFKNEMLSSNKSLSELQAKQFLDLKTDFTRISNQMLELKAENARLCKEVDALRGKISNLEKYNPSELSQSVVSEVLQETFERERCQSNLIFYGVPELTSSIVSERVSHDKLTINNILESLSDLIPQNLKLIRIGKPRSDIARPIKAVFDSKQSAMHLLSAFNSAKRSGSSFLDGFRMVSDKTSLQRKLLRACHLEMERRINDGEPNLRIVFENGIPKVGTATSKNGGLRLHTANNHS